MSINNKREGNDIAGLYSDHWEGIRSGNDEYPKKGRHDSYLVAGGLKGAKVDERAAPNFKTKTIEVFGFNYS